MATCMAWCPSLVPPTRQLPQSYDASLATSLGVVKPTISSTPLDGLTLGDNPQAVMLHEWHSTAHWVGYMEPNYASLYSWPHTSASPFSSRTSLSRISLTLPSLWSTGTSSSHTSLATSHSRCSPNSSRRANPSHCSGLRHGGLGYRIRYDDVDRRAHVIAEPNVPTARAS